MYKCATSVFVVILCLSAYGQGLERASSISIYQDTDFSQPLIPLRELVREKSNSKTNTFYLSNVFKLNSGATLVWVYWKENDALILWEPRSLHDRYDLVWSRRYLRFGKEIVPKEQYIEGTNYMLLEKEGRFLKAECLRGTKLVVQAQSKKQ